MDTALQASGYGPQQSGFDYLSARCGRYTGKNAGIAATGMGMQETPFLSSTASESEGFGSDKLTLDVPVQSWVTGPVTWPSALVLCCHAS